MTRVRCRTGKLGYLSERDAVSQMKSLQSRGKARVPKRTYRCKHCGFYHLTSQPKR